jgi:chromosome segregation ATPase
MGFVKDGAADIYMRHATFWMREYNMRTTEWIRLTVELQQANGRVTEANRQLNVLSTEEAKHIRAEQILREENETLRSQFDRKDERQEQLGRELALAQESNEALQAKILRLQSVARRAKAARAARKVPGKASR